MGILESGSGRPGLAWATFLIKLITSPDWPIVELEPSASPDLSGTGPGPVQPIYHAIHDRPAHLPSQAMIGVLFKEAEFGCPVPIRRLNKKTEKEG